MKESGRNGRHPRDRKFNLQQPGRYNASRCSGKKNREQNMSKSTVIAGPRPQTARHESACSQMVLALLYANAQFPIFPVSPESKRPVCAHGVLDATTDEEQIHAWWRRHPTALVAMPTGERSGFVVLDVDGPQGRASLNAMLAKLSIETVGDLTPVIGRTPSGGLHLYFRFQPGTVPRSRSSDIAAGLDTRGVGGSIILPGNVLPNGKRYELIDPTSLTEVDA